MRFFWRAFFLLALLSGVALLSVLVPHTKEPLRERTSPAALPLSAANAAEPLANISLPRLGLEGRLVGVFSAIEKNALSEALLRTESLIQDYPNYRLAHLIRGDLLLARIQNIDEFGAVRHAQKNTESTLQNINGKLSDLREEAVARLKAYKEKPPQNVVPRYLLQMRTDQRYAIIVDTKRSRLYLYENDPQQKDGRPRFVADYYISQGKLGADKFYEGDKKTPLGVYHVTANLPREKLADLYGHGAFPLNYPNELDKQNGRGGSGIWLHGTPSDTYARPPKASDGCVVLTNADLDSLAKNLQVGLTPVIISSSIEWLSLDDWQKEREELKTSIENWRKDWESRDTTAYLRHYSKSFHSGDKQNFASFAAQKQQVNAGKTWIKVELGNTSVFRYPSPQEIVVVSFEQNYRSNNLDNRMKKRQYWQRENRQWKIVYEGAA